MIIIVAGLMIFPALTLGPLVEVVLLRNPLMLKELRGASSR